MGGIFFRSMNLFNEIFGIIYVYGFCERAIFQDLICNGNLSSDLLEHLRCLSNSDLGSNKVLTKNYDVEIVAME